MGPGLLRCTTLASPYYNPTSTIQVILDEYEAVLVEVPALLLAIPA